MSIDNLNIFKISLNIFKTPARFSQYDSPLKCNQALEASIMQSLDLHYNLGYPRAKEDNQIT
jgi:hypothetical protein